LAFEGRSAIVLGSGARAFGMGGAFLARADDATAASWNPAGLSYLKRPELCLVGVRNVFTLRTLTGDGVLVNDDRLRGNQPDFMSAALPLTLGKVNGTVQLSYQRVIAFQDHHIWRKGYAPQTKEKLIELDARGGFDTLSLGTGLRLSRLARIGATLNYWLNGYEQTFIRKENPSRREAQEFRQFDLAGFNANFGIILTPWESLNVGVVYKTALQGDAHMYFSRRDLDPVTLSDSGSLYYVYENKSERSDLRLDFPGAFGVGTSWRPASPLTLSIDYTRTFWSQSHIYNFFLVPQVGPPEVWPSRPYPTLKDGGKQMDTEQYRIGGEYVLIRSRFKWPLRVGYFNDRQYFLADDGRVPRFNGLSLGAGTIINDRIMIDAALVYEEGSYKASLAREEKATVKATRVYLSFIYRFFHNP
jgi:long-subunit fatty acid transport protein